MSIKETFEVIKEAVHERISSPILGSFAFFVFGFNWQTLVTVWKTQLPIEVALQNLETARITWTRGLILPAACTIVFCLVYPWFRFWLSWYTDSVDTRRIIKRHKAELKILENRKDILIAEGKLEDIKEERVRKAQRAEREHEFKLQQEANQFDYHAASQRQGLELNLAREKALQEVEIERAVEKARSATRRGLGNPG
jgi:hypothetical protein